MSYVVLFYITSYPGKSSNRSLFINTDQSLSFVSTLSVRLVIGEIVATPQKPPKKRS